MQPVLDNIFFEKNRAMLLVIPAMVFVNFCIKGIASFYETFLMKVVGQKIASNVQMDLYKHLVWSDIDLFHQYPSGNLISRFTNDINALKRCISEVSTGILCELLTLIGLIIVMFNQSFNLTLTAFLTFPLAFYPMIILGRKMRKVAKNMQEELGGFTVRLDETFQNIRIIKSYCRELYEISRARKVIERVLGTYKKIASVEAASSPIMETFGGIAVACVIWYGGLQVIDDVTTPGAFFSFITALLMSYKPLKAISQFNNILQEGLVAAYRLFSILDKKASMCDKLDAQAVCFKKHDIVMHNVSFSYIGGQVILDNLCIEIPHNNTVALVGSSGVGKSTILALLQRLYNPCAGYIAIDGYDISSIKLESLRNSMAIVSQEVSLFDDTIAENIRYGRLDASMDDVIKAAEAAMAHDFIGALENGYDTRIGPNGVKLSGGQKQRIAIARAILRNAPILLLDEATSALDSVSEYKVQQAMEYLREGRTTIVIAHRMSTIENADIIYFISEGKVIERGMHYELMTLNGEYAKFYSTYMKGGSTHNE